MSFIGGFFKFQQILNWSLENLKLIFRRAVRRRKVLNKIIWLQKLKHEKFLMKISP